MENFISTVQPFGFIIVFLLFVGWFSSFIVLLPRYKYYRLTYKNLVSQKYVFDYEYGDTIYFKNSDNKYGRPVIFFGDGAIKLAECDEYIHNSIVTFWDPYSVHWFIKLNRWKREFTLKQKLEEIKN